MALCVSAAVVWLTSAAGGSALTMMFSNCSTSDSRPRVLTVNWKPDPSGAGGPPSWPAATWTFCCWIALLHVERRQSVGLELVRVEPDAHAVLAGADHPDLADAGQRASGYCRLMIA